MHVCVNLSFKEALDGADKKIIFMKEVKCKSCKGTRENSGSKSSQCYSCKGEGIKKDPLFHKESKCNTCTGHGYLVVNPCKTCAGTGLTQERVEKAIKVSRFTDHDTTVQLEHEGNQSNYVGKGEDGHLVIRFNVETDTTIRREGDNIISKHYVTLCEALLGCQLTVNTVHGPELV